MYRHRGQGRPAALASILIDSESPFDGEATKELRRVTTTEGLRFYELRLPIRLSREAGGITTDNIFDLLAGFRSEDNEQTTYTRELPFAATGDYYDRPRSPERRKPTGNHTAYRPQQKLLAVYSPAVSHRKAEALTTRVLVD